MHLFNAWEFQSLVLGIFVICSPPFIFGVRISHWTPSSHVWLYLNLLEIEFRGSSCLCLIFLVNSLQRILSICINIYYQFVSPLFGSFLDCSDVCHHTQYMTYWGLNLWSLEGWANLLLSETQPHSMSACYLFYHSGKFTWISTFVTFSHLYFYYI